VRPPNLLIITLDCARHDHVLGNKASTPTIDSLREDGVTFSRAYSQAASTIPSLCSLLTSLYPHQHGHYSNRKYTSMNEMSLPKLLARRGWRTGGFGGVYFLANTIGLDFGTTDKIEPLPWVNERLGLGPTRLRPPPWKGFFAQRLLKPLMYHLGLLKITRNASKTVARAIEWLEGGWEAPFFLWLHPFDAHMVYYSPRRWRRHYYSGNPTRGERNIAQQLKERGIWFVEESYGRIFEEIYDLSYFPALYKAAISYMDEELGRLIDYLKANGQYGNTMLIVTSDHGENLGERGIYCTHRKLFDETTRVPLIIKLPGSEYRGKEIDSLAEHIDLLPTVLDFLDIPPPTETSGRSLLPLMEGKRLPVRFSISEHEDALQFVIRWENWQYYWTDPEVDNPYPFSFERDLLVRTTERGEEVVVAEDEIRGRLREEVTSRVIPARRWYLDPEDRRIDSRLQDLGYI